jgi:CRP-like cAMP-binding protein
MKERNLTRGEFLFEKGDRGKEMYLVEEGQLDIPINGTRAALSLQPGQLAGEHALFFDRAQNVSAVCGSDTCKVHVLYAPDFFALLKTQPALAESFREICYRREFRQALCHLTKKPFPKSEDELHMAFNVIDDNGTGVIELDEVRAMIKRFDPRYTEEQVQDILKALDLNHTGTVSWEEFKRIFRTRRGRLPM